jgi:nucleoside-diphosphate-sugar epimerase
MLSLRNANRRVTVLRCGGLMGYDRIPGKYVRGKKDLTTGEVPVNYVHRDDVIGIIEQLLPVLLPDETFNVVAPLHPVRREVYNASCAEFGWELPTYASGTTKEPFKVVGAGKIVAHLNYKFKYPDPLSFYYSLN